MALFFYLLNWPISVFYFHVTSANSNVNSNQKWIYKSQDQQLSLSVLWRDCGERWDSNTNATFLKRQNSVRFNDPLKNSKVLHSLSYCITTWLCKRISHSNPFSYCLRCESFIEIRLCNSMSFLWDNLEHQPTF